MYLDDNGNYFSGVNCETNIDDCADFPCMHNGKCIDLVNGYSCVCEPPHSGPNCENTLDPCMPNQLV